MFILYSLSFSALKVENNQVIDSYNNKIELKEYKKIVVLDPAVIETLYLIGAENHIAAIGTIARSKIYPEEKVKLLPNVGHINNSSVEKILSFSPDLVLINAMSPKLGDTLKPFNIPYIVVEANSFNDILNNIKLYGKLTGNEENADLLYNKSIEKLNNIKSKITAQPLNMKGTVLYSTSPFIIMQDSIMNHKNYYVLRFIHMVINMMKQQLRNGSLYSIDVSLLSSSSVAVSQMDLKLVQWLYLLAEIYVCLVMQMYLCGLMSYVNMKLSTYVEGFFY